MRAGGGSPAGLGWYRRKPGEDGYQMSVIAEAKRGKSTFVNTLIGRDLLPIDVEVATIQVFNIRISGLEVYPITPRGRLPARDCAVGALYLQAKHA